MSPLPKHAYAAKHSYARQRNYVPKHSLEQPKIKKRDFWSVVAALICLLTVWTLRDFAPLLMPVVCFALIFAVLRMSKSGIFCNIFAFFFTLAAIGLWVYFSTGILMKILL